MNVYDRHNLPHESRLRQEIVHVGALLYQKGLVVATDGNISARLDAAHILATPSGLGKGTMEPDQLLVLDMEGTPTGPRTAANRDLRPTSELRMHLEVYRQRSDVQAVVHAHPPHAIALSIAGISLAECLLPEAIVFLGLPPTTPYATPASEENAEAIRNVITGHDAVILQRHGSLTVGDRPLTAFYRTETLEQVARITFLLKQLGGGPTLGPGQVAKLLAQREQMGLVRAADAEDFCELCGVCHPAGRHIQPETAPDPALIRLITERVLGELGRNHH
jgi:L-fuculose-phosphate aldolase